MNNIDNVLSKISGSSEISKTDVLEWLNSLEPEVMGAAYDLVTDQNQIKRVSPTFSFSEVHALLQEYYLKCIKNDYSGEWIDSRYSACLDSVNWISLTWDEMVLDDRKNWAKWLSKLGLIEIDTTFTNKSLDDFLLDKIRNRNQSIYEFLIKTR